MKVALVTGGAGGIGRACCRRLAAAGCRVALTHHRREEEATALAQEVEGRAYALDLRDAAQIRGLAERVEDELGGVQILVHSAGLIRDALLPFLREEDWEEILAVNLGGAYRLTRAVIKGMLTSRWGRVISIASLSGVTGQPGQVHYSAAKGGLIAFTKALAREVAAYGVTANAVAPGFIDTGMLAPLAPAKLEEYVRAVPVQRLGRPEEVAAAVAFLASDDAAYITGQTLRVDGGLVTA